MVVFQPPGSVKFVFASFKEKTSIPFISTMKARRLLNGGCIGYLANVINTGAEPKFKPKDMPVVSEFLQVFPEDLLGLQRLNSS